MQIFRFAKALDSSKAAAAPLIGFASRPGTSVLQSCEDRFVIVTRIKA
jgi:hypothetical protein